MNNAEQFAQQVFGVDCEKANRHFQGTKDRTVWYRVRRSDATMFVPGTDVLRVNQPELQKYLAAVESFITLDLDDPIYNWENLNLYSYSGEQEVEQGLRKLLRDFTPGQLVAADTETRYLNWDGNKLLSIGFATDEKTCHAFYNIPESLYTLLQEVLDSKVRFCWHNGKFDKNFLWYTCGLRARVDEDTMLKHFAQISEAKGTHGLKYLGPLYLQAPQWDDELDRIRNEYCRAHKIKRADFTYDLIPTSVLIPYMQRDCIATYRLLGLFDRLKEPGTDRVYDLLIRATEAFSWLEVNGVKLDTNQLEFLRNKYTQDLESANRKVADAVSKLWNPMKYHTETGAAYTENFSIGSPKQLKWLLKEATGINVESSDAATIEKLTELVEQNRICADETTKELFEGIALSRKAGKYLDTYVVGMDKAKRNDGRVSGTYKLHGTETGRLSSSNPK